MDDLGTIEPKLSIDDLQPGMRFETMWGDGKRIIEFMGTKNRDGSDEIRYETPLSLFRFKIVYDEFRERTGYPPYPRLSKDDPNNSELIYNTNEILENLSNGRFKLIHE